MPAEAIFNPDSPEFQQWCRSMFAMLNEGGVWGVPRSGLIFTKRDGRLVLTAEMPWTAEMEGTITASELREQQDAEFGSIREHFAAAGVLVEREEVAA